MSKRKVASPAVKPAAIQKKYLNRREVATYLGCSVQNVIIMVHKGMLPEYDLSPFVKRYRIEDIEEFMKTCRREAA